MSAEMCIRDRYNENYVYARNAIDLALGRGGDQVVIKDHDDIPVSYTHLSVIIRGTFLIEGIGAVLLAIRFIPDFGILRGIYFSVFHSISAFCNAGFDLMGINAVSYTHLDVYKRQDKDISVLMDYARARRVVKKVQSFIGVWL